MILEQVGSEVGIGSTQGIVYRTNQHTGLKNGGLRQREVAMVKGVEGIYSELQGCPFGQLRILKQPQVPDVHSLSLKAVAPQGGEGTKLGLHVARIGVLGNVACHAATATCAPGIKGGDAG